MAAMNRLLMAQLAKRGLHGAGGLVRRGITGGAGRVANVYEMQNARRRQAERGLSKVGDEEFESKNYERIAESERRRLRAKMKFEYDSIKKVHKADLDTIKKNIIRVIAENKLRVRIDPVIMDILSINLLKKTTELRKSGSLPKGPLAKKAMDAYISNVVMELKSKLSFTNGRNVGLLTLEINNEIANTLNELVE